MTTENQKIVSLMDFNGNPNIGIYMYTNDKFCLLGQKVNQKKKEEIEKTLNVPVYELTILGTELIGLFLRGNNEILLAPQMFDYEREELKKICKEHEIKLIIIDEIKNTFGNNICVGDKKILINPQYEKTFQKKLKELTNYEIIQINSKKFETIGSTCIHINNKYFLSQEFTENEVKPIIDEIAGIGTINQGSAYIASGIIGNKFGMIIGSFSTTIEIQNLVETLDYL